MSYWKVFSKREEKALLDHEVTTPLIEGWNKYVDNISKTLVSYPFGYDFPCFPLFSAKETVKQLRILGIPAYANCDTVSVAITEEALTKRENAR